MSLIYIYVFEPTIRLFALGRTSTSSSASLSLHLWHFITIPKNLKLDFNIRAAKWNLWFKPFQGQTTANFKRRQLTGESSDVFLSVSQFLDNKFAFEID